MGDEGGDAAASSASGADVSAVGTLVWVRRPNGSWWPGRVVARHEVPACFPAPTRSPATPILLLGHRRDGPVYIDWCNLERCKRVKPFRCGERGLEDLIRRAQEQQQQQAARSRPRRQRAGAGTGARYARKEDAVLQALDIERDRLIRSSTPAATTTTTKPSHPAATATTTTKPSHAATTTKPSHPAATATTTTKPSHAATTTNAQPSTGRKRRTPNDSEDDGAPPQRMKDLTDIGATAPPKHPAFADLNRHLPSTSQMKRSKQSHHRHDSASTAKTRPSVAEQDQQPCRASRKRDRSRPLSELCNGVAWNNGLNKPNNGQRANQHSISSLDTVLLGRQSSRRAAGPVKTEPVDDSSLGTVLLGRSSSRRAAVTVKTEPVDDEPVNAYLAARSVFKADHLHVHQPCASTKAPARECTKRASNCSKDDIPSQCASRNSKKKTITSEDHEGGTRTKNTPKHEHRKERAAKHKAPTHEVTLLEKKVEKSTAANKTVAPDDGDKDLAVKPNGLDRACAALWQHSESKCKHEEPSETRSNHTNCENIPAPSVVFELPRQVLPPQHRDPAVTRCHAVKPIKTLQLISSLYDVEIRAQGASSSGSSKGGRVPLVSLMSRSSRRPVVGYPVSVEVLDAAVPCPPAPSMDDDACPSTSNNTNRPMKEEENTAAAPWHMPPPLSSSHRAVRATRAKTKSRRKASSEDESWRPHTKNSPAASSSPRKMRRLSSFAPGQRGGGDRRPAAVAAKVELCRSHGPALACVPLRLVFSRIHEALS